MPESLLDAATRLCGEGDHEIFEAIICADAELDAFYECYLQAREARWRECAAIAGALA